MMHDPTQVVEVLALRQADNYKVTSWRAMRQDSAIYMLRGFFGSKKEDNKFIDSSSIGFVFKLEFASLPIFLLGLTLHFVVVLICYHFVHGEDS